MVTTHRQCIETGRGFGTEAQVDGPKYTGSSLKLATILYYEQRNVPISEPNSCVYHSVNKITSSNERILSFSGNVENGI